MRNVVRHTAWIALVALGLSLVTATAAQAQYREFTGQIQKLARGKFIIDNRMGDKVLFHRLKETEVDDQRGVEEKKKRWEDLSRDDWVTVQWKMIDKPRKAYKVIVLPPKEDEVEDL